MSHKDWKDIEIGTIFQNGAGKKFVVLDKKDSTVIVKRIDTGAEIKAELNRYFCGNIRKELIIDEEFGTALYSNKGISDDN